MSDRGVCRTASASPGLLDMVEFFLKPQTMMKPKLWLNSNCDETQKVKKPKLCCQKIYGQTHLDETQNVMDQKMSWDANCYNP